MGGPEEIYVAGDGNFEFRRTVSRPSESSSSQVNIKLASKILATVVGILFHTGRDSRDRPPARRRFR
jgi:hypothetical protein